MRSRTSSSASPRRSALAIVAINLFVALFAPLIAPFDQATPVGDAWADPSAQHWLGARQSRPRHAEPPDLWRAHVDRTVAASSRRCPSASASSRGFAAAVAGGWVDQALSRLVDLLLSMPTLIFAFVILSVLGSALPVLIVTIAILDSTKVFRLARAVGVEHRQPRIRRGGAAARRGLVVDRHARDPAQRRSRR